MSVQIIKNLFNEYIEIYTGSKIPKMNIDESLIHKIIDIAKDNTEHYIELSKIIIEHLEKDDVIYKIRLFYIIDSLFKNVGKYYIKSLSKILYKPFEQCFNYADLENKVLLFRIFYTWKYLVPSDIFEKINKGLNFDVFKQLIMNDYGEKIKACDEYNEAQRLKNEKNIKHDLNNKKDKNVSGQNINQKITINSINNEDNKKNQNPEILIKKKRKLVEENPSDSNSITKKKKKIENQNQNNIISNNNPIPQQFNIQKSINISQNMGNTNNLPFMNNNNNQNILQNPEQLNLLLNKLNLQNLINFPFFPNPKNQNISKNEFNIFIFLCQSNLKLDDNLSFFRSLSKFYNESLDNKYSIKINCKYEDIYRNPEFKLIHQNQNNLLFNNIKRNICTICGFRTLYYNKLTEHLDIHFNNNYLKKEGEGKKIFRKKGNNRNSWITGDGNITKKIKDNKGIGIGYTLNNLLYYKNMMNNNIIKIDNEGQEEDNEEMMYPIDDNNIRNCEFCGDEFKKVFSNKYNYWFYNDIVKIKDEKVRLLVHKECYEDMNKKS